MKLVITFSKLFLNYQSIQTLVGNTSAKMLRPFSSTESIRRYSDYCGRPGCRCMVPKCNCFECKFQSKLAPKIHRREHLMLLSDTTRTDFVHSNKETDCGYCKPCCGGSQGDTLTYKDTLYNDRINERKNMHCFHDDYYILKKNEYERRRVEYEKRRSAFTERERRKLTCEPPRVNSAPTYTGYYSILSDRNVTEIPIQKSSKLKLRQKRRFQCSYCEKSFGKSSHLRDHHRTHSGERPFGCRYCGKAFSQFSNLRTHLRIHTGEKPFKCQVCEKSFTQRVTLRSHMRTHTNNNSNKTTFLKNDFTNTKND